MSRQLEQHEEDRNNKRRKQIVSAVEYELVEAVGRAGAEFTGFSIRHNPVECLMVVKGVLAGKPQVAFVGAADMGGAIIKAVRLARMDKLVWKVDKWAE